MTSAHLVPFNEIKLSKARRDLVKGLLPREGLSVVWGAPKSGKSFWMLDVAMHVALGWPYRGRRVQSGPVVYCAFEGQSGLGARVAAFTLDHGGSIPQDVPFFLQPVMLDLVARRGELIELIRQLPVAPVLVVLDTLNRSISGSESSDTDMSDYVKAADAIRSTFCCSVVIVHHCGHDVRRPRGHTALTGACDAQIALKQDKAGNITATVELSKDGPKGAVIFSRLKVVDVGIDEDGRAITSCVVVPSEGSAIASRLRGATRDAFDILRMAIDEAGDEPGAPGTPGNRPTVLHTIWKDRCAAANMVKSDKPDSFRTAFNRWQATLESQDFIGVAQGSVWIANS